MKSVGECWLKLKPAGAGPSECWQNRDAASHPLLRPRCPVSHLDPGQVVAKGWIKILGMWRKKVLRLNLDQEGTDKGSTLCGEFLQRLWKRTEYVPSKGSDYLGPLQYALGRREARF